MPDWSKSMQQTFEFYEVDPETWGNKRLLTEIKSGSSITWDLTSETIGSSTLSTTESLDECYIRTYLVTIQNGVTEKHALGTFLYQTPNFSFDGKIKSHDIAGYSPLTELSEKPPRIGYYLIKNTNILDIAYILTRNNLRAPVIKGSGSSVLPGNFVANTDDTWLTFLTDLLAYAKCEFGISAFGEILFMPKQDFSSMQPRFIFDDSNSSILYPEVALERDLYSIPNVVEVVWTNNDESLNTKSMSARVVNDEPDSPTSIQSRGREIVKRITDPKFEVDTQNPTQAMIDSYTKTALKEASSLEYKLTFSHGYYPVRIGDCIMLDYKRAGLNFVKAKIIRQKITCEPGCKVETTAVYTKQLWG